MKKTFPILVLICLALAACRQEEPLEWSDTPYLNVPSAWVDSTLQTLSTEEKIGQLLFLDVKIDEEITEEVIANWMSTVPLSGLQIQGLTPDRYLKLQENLAYSVPISLLQSTEEQVLLNNQFAETGDAPPASVLAYLFPEDSLRRLSRSLFKQQMQSLGINMQCSPLAIFEGPAWDLLAQHHLQFVDAISPALVLQDVDSVYWDSTGRNRLLQLQDLGVAGFVIEEEFLQQQKLTSPQLADLFRDQLDFKGLLLAEAKTENALQLLAGTIDVLRLKDDPRAMFELLQHAYQTGILSEIELDIRVAKVLQAKEWVRQQKMAIAEEQLAAAWDGITVDQANVLATFGNRKAKLDTSTVAPLVSIKEHFEKDRWRLFNRKVYEETSILVHNRHQILPFRDLFRFHYRLIHLGTESRAPFEKTFGRYADFSKYYHIPDEQGQYARLRISTNKWEICIITLEETLDEETDAQLLEDLRELAAERDVVLVHFGEDSGLAPIDTSFSVLHFPAMNETTQELAAQVLFGGFSPRGKLPRDVNTFFPAGKGESLRVSRLSYQIPEALGIAPEKLVGIDAIAQNAIAEGAFPGCQVLIAKNGSVVYSKAFGYHDFSRKRKVRLTDLYDVASITKVAATTLAAMKLYEQKKFKVNDRLKNYLDCPPNSTIKNITLKKLLTHQSGIQPHMPVVSYLLYRDTFNVGCDSFFCNKSGVDFPYQVADSFYFSKYYHDQIWNDMHKLQVRKNRRFRYSDANFYLMQQILEKSSGSSLDDLVRHYFYTPLGLRYATFRPLHRFSRDQILPTQLDERWRQQLIHGYVHDETAALLNGVAGHAGLFSNAEDLAILFQMLLNNGYYGGHQYLNAETINLFTSAIHGNHRGFGFDTAHRDSHSPFAMSTSERTFGHTGFTGTCVWADPENDLVFVFLSNRINPDIRNKKLFHKRIRERMHQIAYDALDTYQPKEIEKGILVE